MDTRTLLIAVALVVAVGLIVGPSPAIAQNFDGAGAKRIEPAKHDGKGGIDLAAARADADAKARQSTDVDVKNKLNQKQAAIGVGIGGGSSVDVKNKVFNANVNTLKTGDVTNYNANVNKQIQSFGIPFGRDLTTR